MDDRASGATLRSRRARTFHSGVTRLLAPCGAGALACCRGRALFDVATDPGVVHQVPLGIWATYGWGQSRHFKAIETIDAAHAWGTFSLRRGFCLPLLGNRPGRRVQSGLKHLAHVEPDLAPTIAAIERP